MKKQTNETEIVDNARNDLLIMVTTCDVWSLWWTIFEIISIRYEILVNTIEAVMKKEKNKTEMFDDDRKEWLLMVTTSDISRPWIVSYGVQIVTLLLGTLWYFDSGFSTFIYLTGLSITLEGYFWPNSFLTFWAMIGAKRKSRYSKFCRNFVWLVC